MKKSSVIIAASIGICLSSSIYYSWRMDVQADSAKESNPKKSSAGYVGSASCRECHESFYKLWATSHHGLAMQPYTSTFAQKQLQSQAQDIRIGPRRYRAARDTAKGWVREIGPEGEKKFPIAHVMGGKNVYYFLTPYEKGRLQVLPLAYDVHKKSWFDTAASGVRHFPGQLTDAPLHWTDPEYTFNTSCYSCHVSQLSTNYDLEADTYHTVWAEPGINCEACHGPGEEHVRAFKSASKDKPPKDLKLISTKNFTAHQLNSMCASCHAKLSPVTPSFTPGERFFDHYNLVTLEHLDFYPDGRDLGENYTMTGWRMSPCAKSGKLDCMHCHTSSGRYRFTDAARANNACLPCHKERVENATKHTRHKAESKGNQCISCHMPMTGFARMNRSDHSMRPPTPAATIAYKSPNACNLCHTDEDATWADKQVRDWHKHDYQNSALYPAGLVAAARKPDWNRLDDMLAYLTREDRDEIFATSLVRLLRGCESDKKWPVISKLLINDSSPLVRAAAAEGLDNYYTTNSLQALIDATQDEYRLVRVRAVASLAGIPLERFKDKDRLVIERAAAEYLAGLNARPDDHVSHYNRGNFYLARQQHTEALKSYQTAIKLRPNNLLAHVNAAFAYNGLGQNDRAEASLRQAIKLDPNNLSAHLNLALILGEQGRLDEAERAYRKVIRLDKKSAVAAYNIGVILARKLKPEALDWCRKAYELQPGNVKYGYTYAYYLMQFGQIETAIPLLEKMICANTPNADVYALLGGIYEQKGDFANAIKVYDKALSSPNIPDAYKQSFDQRIRQIRRR
jgi:tetratricopeptide (TPR) repeat protein